MGFCIREKLFLDNLSEIIDLANRTQKDEYVDLDALKGTFFFSTFLCWDLGVALMAET